MDGAEERVRKVAMYDAWLNEQHPEYQEEKRSKMYDPHFNGGVRHDRNGGVKHSRPRYKGMVKPTRTTEHWLKQWYDRGTPVEWVYYLESIGYKSK